MKKHKEYIELLESILENVERLRDSVIILLKAIPKTTKLNPNPNQSAAIHAQYFIYIALEELGKFYLILDQYDKKLNGINMTKIGFGNHDTKIEKLLDHSIKMQEEFGVRPNYADTIPDMVIKIRKFKEDNIYINYQEGKIIKPKVNRGKDIFTGMVNFLRTSLDIARLDLHSFKSNPDVYKK